jgi:hypothetical protein
MTRWLPVLCFLAACSAPPPAGGDSGVTEDDGGTDAGTRDAGVRVPGCTTDNAVASVTARDGFEELCVDAGTFPNAQCGDGSALKLSWRASRDGGTGLFLFFRGAGRCSEYIGCWGRDGKGGEEGRTVARLSNTERVSPPVSFGYVAHGLFNETEPANPLAGYSAVHVPDCTADLGARDEVVDLAKPVNANVTAPPSVRTYFRGAADVEAAVALAKERFPSPSRIVLGGSGEGVYFALAALPKVDAAWPNVPLVVLSDGEVGVGDSAQEQKFRFAASSHDGANGRPVARFVSTSFVSDPVQRGNAASSALTFQSNLKTVLEAREVASPSNVRWFAPAPACHTVALSPGLWQQYVKWTGGLRPAQPAQRPNPDLGVDGGVSGNLGPWLFEALSGNGAFDAGFKSLGADFGQVSMDCALPGSLEP